MTLVIHSVGAADLGVDIRNLSEDKKARGQAQALERMRGWDLDEPDQVVAGLLFPPEGSRFRTTPLGAVLTSLGGARGSGQVKVVLLESSAGSAETTREVAACMHEVLGREGVRDALRKRLGVTLLSKRVSFSTFQENDIAYKIEQELCDVDSKEEVIVNGMSGATKAVLAMTGAVDRLGLRWSLAVSPDSQGRAVVLEPPLPGSHTTFFWLRSLGYLEEAQRCLEAAEGDGGSGPESARDREEREHLTQILQTYREHPDQLSESGLATVLRLDMARADNGAALAVRAWVREHYWSLRREEKRKGGAGKDLFERDQKTGREPEVGRAIGAAQRILADKSGSCPGSARWLAGCDRLNNIGMDAVHRGMVPTADDVRYVEELEEAPGGLPQWVSRPTCRPVLYVVPCGTGSRGPQVPQRVLEAPVDPRLRRAVPGGMLADPGPLRAAFVLLHSSRPDSRQVAQQAAASALLAVRHQDWVCDEPAWVDTADYGSGEVEDLAPSEEVMRRAGCYVETALGAKEPAAVVVVGTGQKQVVFGALRAARKWCASHAVPLFLQTFIDDSRSAAGAKGAGKEGPGFTDQLHRIALHREAEQALCQAALTSLRSLNLVSAARVLSAGDYRMAGLAEECEYLRQSYQNAAGAENLDEHAGVILDILRVVSRLARSAGTTGQDLDLTRLLIVSAELITPKQSRKKNTTLLHEGPGRLSAADRSELLALNNLSRGELRFLVAKARDRVLVAHGRCTVKEALAGACADVNVAEPVPLSLDALLDQLACVLECDARNAGKDGDPGRFTVDTTSTWKSRFDELMRQLQPEGSEWCPASPQAEQPG